MKIVVIGGTGLIGSKLAANLRSLGHDVLASSPSSGVNTLTGEGLAAALAGAQVVVDVSNSPSFEDKAVLEFFEKSGRTILAAEKAAGVKHHVALSVVGTDRLPDCGYFRAKLAQEKIIKAGGIPFSIVRSTQFFEFLGGIARSGFDGTAVRLSPAFVQPISSGDIAAIVAEVTVGSPLNGMIEVAGPERFRLNELVQRFLAAKHDARPVFSDPRALYFGAELKDLTLVPANNARLGKTRYQDVESTLRN